jgi:hypothetical protein
MPLADGVAYADKWLSLSDPGQLFVVGAAMRSRGELALADELERKRANTGRGRIGRLFLNTRLLAIYRVPELRSVVAKLEKFLRKRTESL